MLLSNGLLAASLLLGQPATSGPTVPIPPLPGEKIVQVQNVPPAPALLPPQPAQPSSRPILGFFRSEERPILSKIQGWWKGDRQDAQPTSNQPVRGGTIRETPPPPISNPTPLTPPPAGDFYKRMPNPTSKATTPSAPVVKETAPPAKDIQQTSLQQVAVPKSAKSPILSDPANSIGRDEKFEWITGQFEIENGNFVLYYATPETVDKYHGRIVLLSEQADLKQFRRGDLVSVRGQLSQRQTTQGIMPIYSVTLATKIERPKQ